nr:cathelicidin [Leptobrachium liui]
MDSFVRVYFALCVSSSVVTCVSITTSKPWTNEKISALATESAEYYNYISGENDYYRLLNPKNPSFIDTALGLQKLNFTVKQTECKKWDKRSLWDCPFRKCGIEKDCSATIDRMEEERTIQVTCVINQHAAAVRTKRSRPCNCRCCYVARGNGRCLLRPGCFTVAARPNRSV